MLDTNSIPLPPNAKTIPGFPTYCVTPDGVVYSCRRLDWVSMKESTDGTLHIYNDNGRTTVRVDDLVTELFPDDRTYRITKRRQRRKYEKSADMIGKKYNRLTVVDVMRKNGVTYAVCFCECNPEKELTVRTGSILRGTTKGCGCLRPTETEYTQLRKTREFSIWRGMMRRCYDVKVKEYRLYGKRGIRVCERWKTFVNFLEDMGKCPEGKQMDRIDVNGDYELCNCRWVTPTEQQRNRRNTVRFTYQGKTLSVSEWAEIVGIDEYTLKARVLRYGWSVKKAMETPSRKHRTTH